MTATAPDLKKQALHLARERSAQADELASFRRDALNTLEACHFPDRKTEQWKYTSLATLLNNQLDHDSTGDSATPYDSRPDFSGWCLAIENGVLNTTASALPDQAGVDVTPLSSANAVPVASMRTPFGWLNSAALESGVSIRITKNTCAQKLIHIFYFNHGKEASTQQSRVQLLLEPGSQATLVETFIGQGPVLTNTVTDIHADCNSQLTHYRIQQPGNDHLHINALSIYQKRDSQVTSYQLMQGGHLLRNDVHAQLTEPGASLQLQGIFIARDTTHVDNQICVEHQAPHCTSDQVYKGMAGEQARAVFNGRIHIFPGAQGTLAELSNKNLLLSHEAEIDTKPELEIYNDDVRCAHGTTVGQIDETSLFYLQSRGIARDEAKRMLGLGFVNEILRALPDASVAEWAQDWADNALVQQADMPSAQ